MPCNNVWFVWSEVKKTSKVYGKTFLTRPRRYTNDPTRATRSRFQWHIIPDGRFSLTLLGVINGLLPFGIVLVAHIRERDKGIKGYRFARKWW